MFSFPHVFYLFFFPIVLVEQKAHFLTALFLQWYAKVKLEFLISLKWPQNQYQFDITSGKKEGNTNFNLLLHKYMILIALFNTLEIACDLPLLSINTTISRNSSWKLFFHINKGNINKYFPYLYEIMVIFKKNTLIFLYSWFLLNIHQRPRAYFCK